MDIQVLWNEYHLPVRRFIAKRTFNHSDVEDIVQNVFIKIYGHISELKDENKVQSWIYQIARNSIVDYYRKEKRTEELPFHIETNDEYEEENFEKEVISCFESTIQRLPNKYKEALELTELKGISQKQLSSQLAISYSGAKSRVQRGREMLKERLMECCHIESDRYGNIIEFYRKYQN
ncbi:RNA polymerase sigma factor SigZ [Bacillus gobiensis]|uniref:RNA polymerase sigma factor SigZ n=1 Tax=Bacillus gobiensis TaxID=1441095 RepID=UPI003D1EE05E